MAVSQEAAGDEDLSDQIIGQGLSARILADRGRHAEAVELASSAVALAAQTDLLSQHADALLDLAYAMAAVGRAHEARAAATQALDLYQRKGNLPGAREATGYLANFEGALPMSHGWVRRIELDDNDNLSLLFALSSTYVNTPIEISGTATQPNGAVATFYDVKTVPPPDGNNQMVNLTVGPIPTVGKFLESDPITVVARAAYVWITSLQAGGSSQASVQDDWNPPSGGSFQAAWKMKSFDYAIGQPGQHPAGWSS